MEPTSYEKITYENPTRRTAVHALAIIGFLALVVLGIILAIYAARYVPGAVSDLTFWGTGNDVSLTAVPTTTIPFDFGTGTTTTATTTYPIATTTPAGGSSGSGSGSDSSQVIGYHTVTSDSPSPGATQIQVPTVYTGLANLTVSITAVGYINDNGDFVADSTIDHDQRLAVKILVTNTGTNKTGEWRIHTVVPTRTDSTFEHDENEPNLEPNGILPLTLTLERGQPHIGDDEKISVEVDTDNDVDESNENDNDATATISVN